MPNMLEAAQNVNLIIQDSGYKIQDSGYVIKEAGKIPIKGIRIELWKR